jgi:hypothetical protein
MADHFYHSITKKAVIAFGSLFNDIYVVRYNSDGSEKERFKVPLMYMTKQKFLSRVQTSPDLANQIEIKLPAMSFEFNQFVYDAARKNNSFQKTVQKDTNNDYYVRYGRVPYNLNFILNIVAKNTEDALQIIEQILPWFTPEYSVTVKMVNPTDMSVDVPFVIQNIVYEEEVEDSDFQDRKLVTVSVEFTSKLFYYGALTKLPLAATGATSSNFYGSSVEVPKGMIGKVVNVFEDFDSGMTFQTLTIGVTGDSNPYNFNPCLTGNENQYYVTLSEKLF